MLRDDACTNGVENMFLLGYEYQNTTNAPAVRFCKAGNHAIRRRAYCPGQLCFSCACPKHHEGRVGEVRQRGGEVAARLANEGIACAGHARPTLAI